MPFVKKVRKRTKQGFKTYLYLARNYREKGKIKQEIIRSLTLEEAQELQQGPSLNATNVENSTALISEVEHLRSENLSLTQRNIQLEAELALERAQNSIMSQNREESSNSSSRKAREPNTLNKPKRKTKKISLQQFLSS
ncbi:MAG: hypothetical protein ACE5OZ_08425 [Candidatus Heimdallarchaeota archaeon]